MSKQRAAVVQAVKKSFGNLKVASSIPCQSILEQDTELLIGPDVQCAISVNVKCVYILVSCFGGKRPLNTNVNEWDTSDNSLSRYPSPPQTLNSVYGHVPPLYHTFVFLPLSLSLAQFLSFFTPPHSFSPTLFLSTSLIFLSLSLYLPLFTLPPL